MITNKPIQIFSFVKMDSSDEDFLPDPGRFRDGQGVSSRKRKKPPDDDDNQQSGLYLHEDSTKGKCFFIIKSDKNQCK